jgi:hypothetical protein
MWCDPDATSAEAESALMAQATLRPFNSLLRWYSNDVAAKPGPRGVCHFVHRAGQQIRPGLIPSPDAR